MLQSKSIQFSSAITNNFSELFHSHFIQAFVDANHDDDGLDHDGDGQWPFNTFVEQLIIDMFDPGKRFTPVVNFFFNSKKSARIK